MTTEKQDSEGRPCFNDRRIECIKQNVLNELYNAGRLHGLQMSECYDEHGHIDHEDKEDIDYEAGVVLEVYKKVIDIVWGDYFQSDEQYLCEDCAEKIISEKIIKDREDNLNPN